MFKRIVGCLLLIMATANIAEAIDGDIDLDVDFDDFLILVQNFGKQGPPSPARTDTIYVTKTDTVFITVRDTIYIEAGTPVIPYDRDLIQTLDRRGSGLPGHPTRGFNI